MNQTGIISTFLGAGYKNCSENVILLGDSACSLSLEAFLWPGKSSISSLLCGRGCKAISVHMSGVGHSGTQRAELNCMTGADISGRLLSLLVPCFGDMIFVHCGFFEVSPLPRIK